MSSVSAIGFTSALGAASLRNDAASPSASQESPEAASGSSLDRPAVIVSLSDGAEAAVSAAAKDFATVATDARAMLDVYYQERGAPLDEAANEDDWKKAFSSLDRRSLFAIASNEGNQFSEREQNYAKKLMAEQREAALTVAPHGDPSAARRVAANFLNGVSNEEKASIGWTKERVTAQTAYEILSDPFAKPANDVTSDSPLARFIKAAYAARANVAGNQ